MIKMIGDPELAEKFPALAEMQKKQGDKPNPRFIEMIRGCGFEKMLALLSKSMLFLYQIIVAAAATFQALAIRGLETLRIAK